MNKYIFSIITLSISVANIYPNLPRIVQEKINSGHIKVYTDSVETETAGYGDWFPKTDGEYLIIKAFVKEGDIVFDAGAHVGEWSALALEHTKNQCKLHSFEPVPNFFEKLKKEVNGNAHCYQMALGEAEFDTTMNYYYQESEGCSSLFDRKVLSAIPVKKISIPVVNLDKFCKVHKIKHINFLKIDVEGAEWAVLQGADHLIASKKIDFLQFEYGGTFPDANITLSQIYCYLTDRDYSIFRITSDGLIHIPKWRNELENYHLCNYLAIPNN